LNSDLAVFPGIRDRGKPETPCESSLARLNCMLLPYKSLEPMTTAIAVIMVKLSDGERLAGWKFAWRIVTTAPVFPREKFRAGRGLSPTKLPEASFGASDTLETLILA